jgi:hypothetical protein
VDECCHGEDYQDQAEQGIEKAARPTGVAAPVV